MEQRIATALTGDLPVEAIGALLGETERAIAVTEAAAEVERERALDVTASPDPKAAREAVQAAEFALHRLQTALPRLQARYDRAFDAERLERWRAEYQRLEVQRDALAAEFRELYPEIEGKLVDLLDRMQANNAELSRLHLGRPAGVKLHLLEAELLARGMDRFASHEPSIAMELLLPTFAADARLAWPHR